MSILTFIESVCVQDMVYWEFTGVDEYSSPQFLAPVDMTARWDEGTHITTDNQGKELIADIQVLTPIDLVEQSYLMLGTVASLPVDADPLELDEAFEIKVMNRHPLFQSETFDVFLAFMRYGSRRF